MEFLDRVSELVQSKDFFQDLISNIEAIDNPMAKAKLQMELLNYVAPKIKSQDVASSKQGQSIIISFTDAEKPTEDSEGGTDTDGHISAIPTKELPSI